MKPSVGIVLSAALGLYSLRRITSNPGAGNLLSEVRVFDRALVISLRKMFFFFRRPSMGHFRLCILRPSNLGLFRFPFQHVARKKYGNASIPKDHKIKLSNQNIETHVKIETIE